MDVIDTDVDWRLKLVLQEFQGRTMLRYADLPAGVGRKTMQQLVDRGVVRIATMDMGPYADQYAWLLVH